MGTQICRIHYKRFVYKNQQIAIKNLRFCGWNAMQSKLNRCVGNDLCVVPQDLCGLWQDVEVLPPQGVRIAVGLFRFLRANTVRPLRWGGCRARACSRRFCSCELRRARNARPYGVCITVRLCENRLCSGGRGRSRLPARSVLLHTSVCRGLHRRPAPRPYGVDVSPLGCSDFAGEHTVRPYSKQKDAKKRPIVFESCAFL